MLKKNDFDERTSEELFEDSAVDRDELTDYLLVKYKKLVAKNANQFFIIGAETEDLIQEGMIGLMHAIRDFDIEKSSSFYYFADMCIKRQMYKALDSARTKKNSVLNQSLSIDDENSTLTEEAMDYMANPENMVIDMESASIFFERLKKELSPMERSVLSRYIAGFDYREIAGILGKSPKSVDNALTRIKKKAAGLRKRL